MKINTADFLRMARFHNWINVLEILSTLAVKIDSSSTPSTGTMKTFFRTANPKVVLCIGNQTITHLIICRDPDDKVAQYIEINGKITNVNIKLTELSLRKKLNSLLKNVKGTKIEQRKIGVFRTTPSLPVLWCSSLTSDSWTGSRNDKITQEMETDAMKANGITTNELTSAISSYVFRKER